MTQPVAALFATIDGVVVVASDWGPVLEGLVLLGGRFDGERVELPLEALEEAGAMLDRHGYVWAADTTRAPRTWAERLFAEVPAVLHEVVYVALCEALAGEVGRDARAVLAMAYGRDGESVGLHLPPLVAALDQGHIAVLYEPVDGEVVHDRLEEATELDGCLGRLRHELGRARQISVAVPGEERGVILEIGPDVSVVHTRRNGQWWVRRTQWVPPEARGAFDLLRDRSAY